MRMYADRQTLANSIWLNDSVEYKQDTINRLAQKYYSSVFSGVMGSEDYNDALRGWLNEQTDGLLADQTEGLSMDASTVISLASTINFRAKWNSEFSESQTTEFSSSC